MINDISITQFLPLSDNTVTRRVEKSMIATGLEKIIVLKR